MPEKGNWKPHNVLALERNIALVFRTGDISKLNKPTYNFIILEMGFIAHYDLGGFQDVYRDIDELRQKLQTSEYYDDPEYNLRWADKYEGDRDFNKWYGPSYCKSVAQGIRRIVALARTSSEQPARGGTKRGQPQEGQMQRLI